MPLSFCAQSKLELDALPVKNTCCRKALLYGLLFRCETEGDTLSVTLPVTSEEISGRTELLSSLARKQLGRSPDVEREVRGAHIYLRVSVTSHPAAVLLRRLSEMPTEEEPDAGSLIGFRCEECAHHFLRGVYLAAGTVNDPAKSAHFEFRVPDDGRGTRLDKQLQGAGWIPGRTVRDGVVGLYFKSHESISELMAAVGAVSAYFRCTDAQINGDIRRFENRMTNAETHNIRRAVSASGRHLLAITNLEAMGLLSRLPADLQLTAQLRRDNPDVSLSELAALHDPPITKSGLNHRLERLAAICEKAEKSGGL